MWSTLPRPILIQAPMEDVSDTVFRQMLVETAPPDVFFTEFTNVDGIFSKGKGSVEHRLKFSEIEQKAAPIVAQIWGHKPENYYNGTKYVKELGFDGVDINMGCPQKDIVKKGLCSGLINNHELASQVIKATLDAAHEGSKKIPVSVKTRIGVKEIVTDDWVRFLLSFELGALTIHGRTVKEMSKVPAHWDEIARAVQIRDELKHTAVIIGNGDVRNAVEALEKVKEYGVDGVMIGRGMFENIFAFDKDPEGRYASLSLKEKLALLRTHLDLFEKTWAQKKVTIEDEKAGDTFHKRFYTLKKYYKVYIKGFDGASELRGKLMEATTIEQTYDILSRYES